MRQPRPIRVTPSVVPGDQLIFELSMIRRRGKTFVMSGVARVDGQPVAEAELMAAVVDKE